MTNRVEQGFERALFASRWLMAPMYLGLVVALGMLAMVFVRELFHYLPNMMEIKSADAILMVFSSGKIAEASSDDFRFPVSHWPLGIGL